MSKKDHESEECPESSYFDLCYCGALWKAPGIGVTIQSHESVMCMACKTVAVVAPNYVKELRRA